MRKEEALVPGALEGKKKKQKKKENERALAVELTKKHIIKQKEEIFLYDMLLRQLYRYRPLLSVLLLLGFFPFIMVF